MSGMQHAILKADIESLKQVVARTEAELIRLREALTTAENKLTKFEEDKGSNPFFLGGQNASS